MFVIFVTFGILLMIINISAVIFVRKIIRNIFYRVLCLYHVYLCLLVAASTFVHVPKGKEKKDICLEEWIVYLGNTFVHPRMGIFMSEIPGSYFFLNGAESLPQLNN
jgi:hypothetical protein